MNVPVIYARFANAWNMLYEVALPVLAEERQAASRGGLPPLAFFPLAAGAAGMAAAAAAGIGLLSLSPGLAAPLFGLAAVLFWDMLSHGKESAALARIASARFLSEEDDGAPLRAHVGVALFVARALCAALVIHAGCVGWLAVAALLSGAVQGCLARWDDQTPYEGFVRADAREEGAMWIVTLLACLVLSLSHFPAAVLAYALALLGAKLLRTRLEPLGGPSGALVGAAGKAAESLALLLGAALLNGR